MNIKDLETNKSKQISFLLDPDPISNDWKWEFLLPIIWQWVTWDESKYKSANILIFWTGIGIGSQGLVFGAIVQEKVKSVSWHGVANWFFRVSAKQGQHSTNYELIKKWRKKGENKTLTDFWNWKKPTVFLDRPTCVGGWDLRRWRQKEEVWGQTPWGHGWEISEQISYYRLIVSFFGCNCISCKICSEFFIIHLSPFLVEIVWLCDFIKKEKLRYYQKSCHSYCNNSGSGFQVMYLHHNPIMKIGSLPDKMFSLGMTAITCFLLFLIHLHSLVDCMFAAALCTKKTSHLILQTELVSTELRDKLLLGVWRNHRLADLGKSSSSW